MQTRSIQYEERDIDLIKGVSKSLGLSFSGFVRMSSIQFAKDILSKEHKKEGQ